MVQVLGISETIARILANRGIRSKLAAKRYLDPDIRRLGLATGFKDMPKAASMLKEAIGRGEKVAIYGDYDVDGVMGTVILVKLMRWCGASPRFVIPKRTESGYGLSVDAVKALHGEGVGLLVTCDNGISAIEEIEAAKGLGMKVIVLDHHEPGYALDENGGRRDKVPDADCIVDPKQISCGYPFKQYCAAGIAYRLIGAMEDAMGKAFPESNLCLALAAIATVCDIVPLLEENRMLVKRGIDILNLDKRINLGLWHLMMEKKIQDKAITVFDIGYVLGPCINASGRLSHAAEAVDLFLSDDPIEAAALASKLASLNETRKDMTEKAFDRAMDMIFADDAELGKVLVLFDEETDESIAGVVAGRIKERLCRPVIMLTRGGGAVKGSARSIEAYNIFEALRRNADLFIRFGGHAMAAGLMLEERNIVPLRERLNAECSLSEENFIPALYIDMQLQPEEATFALVREIALLSPFGKDNPEPLFIAKGLRLERLRLIDEKNTILFTFSGDRSKKGVCFGLNDSFRAKMEELYEPLEASKILAGILRESSIEMDVVYAPEINMYNNKESVQMRIKDFRIYKR
jgi:single-stranded-DNA-specific exonuclease